MSALPPGSTIGIIGGGQLARMLSMAAAQLGYRCFIYAPEDSGPAADVCAKWVQGDYADEAALTAFARSVDVVTFEFENVDPAPLRRIAEGSDDGFYQGKLQTARFYFARLFPETASLMRSARAGSQPLMDTDAALA